MEGAKPMKTPTHASNPLSRDESSKLVDHTINTGMIDLLLYLTSSRPNRRLIKLAEHETTTWILPLRPPVQMQPDIQVYPNLYTRLYHAFKGYKIPEW